MHHSKMKRLPGSLQHDRRPAETVRDGKPMSYPSLFSVVAMLLTISSTDTRVSAFTVAPRQSACDLAYCDSTRFNSDGSCRSPRWSRILAASSPTGDVDANTEASRESENLTLLEGSETLLLTLNDGHRPMGCTIEESLADGKYVFVSSVTPGGFADEAGLKHGDVITGLSDVFSEDQGIKDVTFAGIEKIKFIVGSTPDDEILQIRVARGSRVMDEHDRVLVELCSQPGATDEDVEQCVIDFLRDSYADTEDGVETDDAEECSPFDGDTDCAVDSLYNMWAEELPESPAALKNAAEDDATENKAEKAKPWSSRSSPSGTFVRDPATGKMRNLDDQ